MKTYLSENVPLQRQKDLASECNKYPKCQIWIKSTERKLQIDFSIFLENGPLSSFTLIC